MRGLIAALLLLVSTSTVHAGAWGYGQFENDHALDTASDWSEAGSVDSIRHALDAATSARYLDSDVAVEALVAAEVVAAALGKPNHNLPADLSAWISRQPANRLRALAPQALAALARVRSPEGSELYELWAENDAEEWLTQVSELAERLSAAAVRPVL
ncbi:hypothetical protein ASE35_11455 [Lysobacter sp. Root916]|uniref:DUF4259 domain-containing protein n=1 Tax=Lysobacter sp. Root916 TaxID=1736606 RepID=UPI000709390D|nr:DUF4259 domain-containing protein [Lysobacter sp. Root916]KRD34320.1 hypothetical protein ASE35_11455 [Lysobacter sp. Root916]